MNEAYRLRAETLGPGHEKTLKVRYEVARAERGLGNAQRSFELLDGGLPLVESELGTSHPLLPNYEAAIARALADLGQLDEARELLTAVLEDLEAGRRSSAHLSAGRVREMLDEL